MVSPSSNWRFPVDRRVRESDIAFAGTCTNPPVTAKSVAGHVAVWVRARPGNDAANGHELSFGSGSMPDAGHSTTSVRGCAVSAGNRHRLARPPGFGKGLDQRLYERGA